MFKNHNLKIFLIALLLTLPQLSFANGIVSSTIKNPDPYSGNQSWFRYYESPGNTVKDSVILRNLGDQPITIKVYATDAASNQAGSFTLKTNEEEQKGIGLWAKVDRSEVTIQPDENIEVPFEINIPKDLAPGEYFGGIINEEDTQNSCDPIQSVSGQCTGNIQIKTRSGNRIYLTIPGEVKQDIKMTNFSWKQGQKTVHFNFTFVNKGNVSFEPKAVIDIYNSLNQKIATIEKTLGKSLPNSTISPIVDWEYANNFGPLTAKAKIYYNEEDHGQFNNLHGAVLTDSSEVSMFIFPWMAILIVATIVFLIAGFFIGRKKYHQHLLNNSIDYTVKADDNIMDIAADHQAKWQLIACLNGLKAPYVLTPGQKLKIPTKKVSKTTK